jgi:uncharacterized metal-binding protein YceD (DUF177 family)
VEKLSEYTIAFKGLKEGKHDFEFHIGNPFFEHFENSLVEQADILVVVTLEKRTSFLSLFISLKGTVKQPCDLCLEWYDHQVYHKAELFIKFGEDISEDGDDVIWLHPDDYQFNVAQIIYELICLSIPLKHVHPFGKDGSSGCNPEMLKKIKEFTSHSAGKPDSRWDQLKSLLNKN